MSNRTLEVFKEELAKRRQTKIKMTLIISIFACLFGIVCLLTIVQLLECR